MLGVSPPASCVGGEAVKAKHTSVKIFNFMLILMPLENNHLIQTRIKIIVKPIYEI